MLRGKCTICREQFQLGSEKSLLALKPCYYKAITKHLAQVETACCYVSAVVALMHSCEYTDSEWPGIADSRAREVLRMAGKSAEHAPNMIWRQNGQPITREWLSNCGHTVIDTLEKRGIVRMTWWGPSPDLAIAIDETTTVMERVRAIKKIKTPEQREAVRALQQIRDETRGVGRKVEPLAATVLRLLA